MGKKKRPQDPNLDFMADHMSDSVAHDGGPKEKRYKNWRQDIGAMPEYKEIPKELLVIDRRYQRNINESKVKAIAADFWWPAFGAAIVVERPGGFYSVPDAQNRVLAAMRRSDVTKIPCMVNKVASTAEEADIFLRINTFRKALTALDRFNPQVETGHVGAKLVRDLVDASDRVLGGNQKNSIRCVGALVNLALVDAKRLVRIWPILLKLTDGVVMLDVLVRGLFTLDARVDGGIADPRIRDRILFIGHATLVKEARNQQSLEGKGGDRVWADGMLRILNKGLHNKIELRAVNR